MRRPSSKSGNRSWTGRPPLPGAGEAVLTRDQRAPERFVSFAVWESMEAVSEWKQHPEFKPRMGRVQEHIDKFAPTELDVVRRIGGGA